MDCYSVEVREATKGGNDYTEDHYDFDTPEKVRKFIAELSEDERVHSVLLYPSGTDCNPIDVTNRFKKK